MMPRMAKYTLPELQYDYGALEPHISAKIMQLHHDKHHAAYVAGANKALEGLEEARAKNDFAKIALLEKQLGFNLSGHVLHSIFWQNLKPQGGGEPTGELATQIQKDFGSFAGFKAQLTNATATVMGSGWGALIWEPVGKRLTTVQIHDHQSETGQGSVPLLVIDAWEHAWYLQYVNEKAKFFDAVWNIFNWEDVAARFANAKKHDLSIVKAAE
jgi:Fe-Mn family superoxide dismutase